MHGKFQFFKELLNTIMNILYAKLFELITGLGNN